ncbi:restriction endonuclease [Nocardia sp. CA-145437]|uniref:restriction endonuclease n=1 Tax=Nocardia sp. CA-145437 TaxID=3239980 RepID=UPI003D98942C
MARIRKITPGVFRVAAHDPDKGVDCEYQIITDINGDKLIHLSSFGSKDRLGGPKSTQSLQFDRNAATQMLQILLEAEDLVKLPINWKQINPDQFEQLLVRRLSISGCYTRITRSMNVNAPDGGRDIEAYLCYSDNVDSEWQERVVVQAKHSPGRSVGTSVITDLVHAQLPLWEGEPVRHLIVATSGSFTLNAVRWADDHNAKGARPRIALWSSSELEAFLQRWPTIAAEFGLIDSPDAQP